MKKIVLICGILASALSVGISAMSEYEWERAEDNCFNNNDKSACQAIIDNGLASVGQCTKDICGFVGAVYYNAGRHKEAIPYFEKVIALGDNRGYASLGGTYYFGFKDYFKAKKYYEIGCNTGNGDIYQSEPCYNLGAMYDEGKGVRQDYHKARELYKKACDMKYAAACHNLGALYDNGQGVKQNRSIAKQYYGKACDLGEQTGCDNYKLLHNHGVQ